MEKLFGTDGIRGIADEKLTNEFAYLIGKFGAYVLKKNSPKNVNSKILVGIDTRISSPKLEGSIVLGITSIGIDVIKVSCVPTPAVGYLIRKHNLLGGVMISASHNPYEYNGIKFFDNNGIKLSDELECEIEKLYFDGINNFEDVDLGVGRIEESKDLNDDYKKFLLSFLDLRLDNLRIALDCANGSSYLIAEEVFKSTGAEIFVINNTPNGVNINLGCGSTHMEGLCEFVIKNNCDFGFAYDGDADRCLAVDHEGNIINGDFIIGIISLYFKSKGILKNDTVVVTVMSNIGLYKALEKLGIKVSKVRVGDKYVFQDMNENGYVIGGEQSGHIILFDNKTGDGILTSLILSQIIKESGKSLKELASFMENFPQVLLNVNVDEEHKTIYKTDLHVSSLIKKYEEILCDDGRILVRESGTENLIRIMVEGKEQEFIEEIAKEISFAIEDRLIKSV